MKKQALFALLLSVLFIAGCDFGSVDVRLTFSQGERYEMTLTLNLTADAFMWVSRSELEQEFETAVAEAKAEGIDTSWQAIEDETGDVSYIITTKGQGFDTLTEGGEWRIEQLVYEGRNAIDITIPASPFADLGMDLSGLQIGSFELEGAHILEHNGTRVSEGVVRWQGLSQGVHAILVPKRRLNWWAISIAAMAILSIGYLAMRMHVSRVERSSAESGTATRQCPRCGKLIDSDATFCTYCGYALSEGESDH